MARRPAWFGAALLGGALGLALGAGGVAVAAASSGTGPAPAPSHPHRPGGPARPAVVGRVTAVASDRLTVRSAAGATVTVTVSSATVYRVPGVSSPSLHDLKVGSRVAVTGRRSGSTVSASTVSVLPAGAWSAGPPVAAGTVASVGPSSFVLTTSAGSTVTVDVSGATRYLAPGVSSPSFSAVKPGAHVAVRGTESGTTVQATAVAILPADAGQPGNAPPAGGATPPAGAGAAGAPAAVGRVTSVGADSFVVAGWSGSSITVDVSGTTTYTEPGSSSPSLADVTVGSFVVVRGSSSSGTVQASQVLIAPAGFRPGGSGRWSPGSGSPTGGSASGGAPTGVPDANA